jgi:[ribosomal protein S5]-alanine N-acetyltransferase
MPMILETPRLRLRTLSLSDSTSIVEDMNNFAVSRNTARIPYPYHHDDALEFLNYIETLDARSCVTGIELKTEPGALVGVVSYEWSATKQDAELGYWLTQRVWGKGIGTEAVSALVQHAFETAEHSKLVACFHDDNPASGRILSKVGFTVVGACSSYSKAQGREVPVTNVVLMSQDWRNKKAAQS